MSLNLDEIRLFIFGCGYSGEAIAYHCFKQSMQVYGTSRDVSKFDRLRQSGVEPVLFNGDITDELVRGGLQQATHLLISIAPDETGERVLNAMERAGLELPELQWAGYLSTVGVYGNHDGGWVDEKSVPKPVSKRSRQRLKAENAWQDWADGQGLPLAIFRLSGIYGPGRNAFVNIEKGTSRRLVKKGQVFNRIHRNDIAKAVGLAVRNGSEGIFNISDDEPAPPQDVVTFACELYGKTPPPKLDFETADISPMARSFYGENKRVLNEKSKRELGMVYDWPNYKTALRQMWKEGSWKASG